MQEALQKKISNSKFRNFAYKVVDPPVGIFQQSGGNPGTVIVSNQNEFALYSGSLRGKYLAETQFTVAHLFTQSDQVALPGTGIVACFGNLSLETSNDWP